ncbi:hypothetical protein VTO42DRAFT_6222 [Malbranchea cinnamomea]
MSISRQEAFSKLRPPCVELSSIGLKFRANLVTARDVLKALEPAHNVLVELAGKDALDEKLAEYAFFPLTHIFNQTQQTSVRCLELAVRCVQILIEKGWRHKLSSQMGKQLLILLTLLAGGAPGQSQDSKPRSEELSIACFDCIRALCRTVQGEDANASIFNEIGSATVVDQVIYMLLEAIMEGPADGVQLSAAMALQALHSRITDRVVLASLMPRTVSSLTKTLRSTAQTRRSFKLLCCCLEILTEDLRVILNDIAVSATKTSSEKTPQSMALDESWLKATVSQVKLALANVIRLRNHDKWEVRHALQQLCAMILEECQKSLEDSLPMIVETVVVLAYSDDSHDAYRTLKHLAFSTERILNILKTSLHSWIIALPRVMQSSDDSARERAIRQISTAFQIMSEVQPNNDILDGTLTTSLCDSVSTAIRSSLNVPQPLESHATTGLEVSRLNGGKLLQDFQPVILGHGSQRGTLAELKSMITNLSNKNNTLTMTRSMLNRLYRETGEAQIAPFWLALSFLKSMPPDITSFDDMIDLGASTGALSRASLVEELYSLSLPLLTDLTTANPENWHLPALALEAVALQSQQLGESFRPELIDTLYPVLQLMGSSNPALQNHAMTCLNIMTHACQYPNATTMLIENVDYLVNSVALKLNTFDISPQAPQVLLMMVRLCGARLIPYLDDLVGSIFAVLDSFHGYPKLVELLFSVLGAIVDEGAKKASILAIKGVEEGKSVDHRKRPHSSASISDLAKELKDRKEKRSRTLEDESIDEELLSHPKRPWSSRLDSGLAQADENDEDIETDSQADQKPIKQEDEKPLSKSHTLLLNIMKSIPPHLSSPSPFLRRSLLSILTRGLPILAHDENVFLPLVNELWPSMSGRITIPTEYLSRSTSLSTSTSSINRKNFDETGLQEEVYVIVASCSAIETMCKGAGDFMSSRVEQDFPRWKKLYVHSWERVRYDSEKAAERQQLRLQQRQEQENANSATSQMKLLSLGSPSSPSHKAVVQSPILSSIQPASTPPPPPLPPSTTKSFTQHHVLFKALTSLFTTLLSHVRLPTDIADEITNCLGSWISFYYPDYYFTFAWRQNTPYPTAAAPNASQMEELDTAIRAMNTWNPDLTWFTFMRGQADRRRSETVSNFSRVKEAMDERVMKEICHQRDSSRQPLHQCCFAEAVI